MSDQNWHYFRLTDLCMSLWHRITENMSYSEALYTYTAGNYVFVANRRKTIEELINLFSDYSTIAGETIYNKLREIYESTD